MTELAELLVWVIVAFAFYCFLLNRLAKFVQPLRLGLARRGERLLQNPNLPPWAARQLRLELDTMFSGWWAVGAALLFMPAILGFATGLIKSPPDIEHAETRREYNLLAWHFALSFIVANPIMGAIFVLELLALVLVVAILGGTVMSFRAATAVAFGADLHRLSASLPLRHRVG